MTRFFIRRTGPNRRNGLSDQPGKLFDKENFGQMRSPLGTIYGGSAKIAMMGGVSVQTNVCKDRLLH